MNYKIFASESVCAGHPDKICDQISDSILDEAIRLYPKSRVAVETLVTVDRIVLAGEITCPEKINYEKIARETVKKLGYTRPELNFTFKSPIDIYIHQQSPEISMGVDTGGAGDQGMMFGYAVNESKELMPLPIAMANRLAERMDELKGKTLPYLRPDGKCEFSINYENGKPKSIDTIVMAAPHNPDVDKETVKKDLYEKAILQVLEEFKMSKVPMEKIILNGTGKWALGGPAADTGVTGRKIVVDTYGGMGRIGGGCFSGKDPTKVDRSAAYGARYVAKNIIATGLADRCEVQTVYVIGYRDPIAKSIETFGTEKKPMKIIEDFAWNLLDLSTKGIVEKLDLLKPIYAKTARYGHFGHPEYPWEKTI